jgi:tetratricopeptide (TPR) repeat protein
MAHANVMEKLFGDRPEAAAIGRYQLRRKLGAGANGVVYLATDEVLKRDVALKVLAPVEASESQGSDAERRWLREARAVARLSHPHVVEIFDVGVEAQRPYLAMELVDGGSLADWLRAGPRSAAEIVACFLQAAEGLAAAHRLGVVHRDFKPANVLMGKDGRVRVADFGLAGFLHEQPTAGEEASLGSSVDGEASTRITHTGAIMGTPAYMAPEQHRGERADARADQYSFCASLWGALVDALPFQGDSIAALYSAKADRRLSSPARPGEIPEAIRAAIVRGLAPDPADRFERMEDLAAALRTGMAKRSERWAWVVCASALVAFSSALALLPAADTSCARVGEELSDAWTPEARDRVGAALEAAGDRELAVRGSARVDAFVAEWTRVRTDTCEQARVASGVDARAVDGAMQCLREAEGRLRSTVEILASIDAGAVAHAPELLHALGDPAGCRAEEDGRSGTPRPLDPALAAIVDDVRTRRAQITPLVYARRIAADDPRVQELVTAAEASGYGPLSAEIHVLVGRLHSGAADWPAAAAEYDTAYALAVEHEHDEMAFDAAVTLTRLHAEPLRQPEDADRWIAYAHAALERAGAPIELRARYEEARGILARTRAETAAALAHFGAAVELWSRATDALPWLQGTALHNYANALGDAGRLDESLAARERAVAILSVELGDDHPLTGALRYSYGADLQEVGRLDEAQAAFERTIAGYRRRLGPDHPWLVKALNEQGLLLRRRKERELARDRFVEALEMAKRTKGVERDELVFGIASNLADVQIALDDHAAAEPLLAETIALGDRIYGEDHPSVAMSRIRLARTIFRQGRAEDAEQMAERALEHASTAGARDIAAHANFELAQIVFDRDPARGLSLAEAALAYWRDPEAGTSEGTPFADSAATNAGLIEAWLTDVAA